jgi:hypothetical protein
MRAMRKTPWIVCVLLILCTAGCSSEPMDVAIRPVRGPSAGYPQQALRPEAAMPSYPILLVDLPRYDAGQPVPPARSRTPTVAERDIDSPPPSPAYVAPVAAKPAAAPTASIAAPLAPRPAAPKKPDPVDIRYVP